MAEVTFEVNGKQYKAKRRMSAPEVARARSIMGAFINMRERIEKAKTDKVEEEKLEKDLYNKTEEQDRMMVELLTGPIGLTDKELNETEYLEAIQIFSEYYRVSTEIVKKSEGQSA